MNEDTPAHVRDFEEKRIIAEYAAVSAELRAPVEDPRTLPSSLDITLVD